MCKECINKTFYCRKRVLQFECPDEYLNETDFVNLFQGFLRLIINTTEAKLEDKYLSYINSLERKLKDCDKKTDINNL